MNTASTEPAPPGGPATGAWRRWLLLFEIAALVGLTIADAHGLVPLSRTPFLVLLGWASLRLRGLTWRDAGLTLPARATKTIALGVLAGLAIELLAIHVTTPLIATLTGTQPDLSEFRELVGNLPLLLVFLAVNWVLAAFGEEMAFRGYLMSRLAGVLGGGPGATRGGGSNAWIASLLLVSVFFGVGHGYQGATGIMQESLSGFWLGVLYLASGRNLTLPIVAHGVSNTLALVLIYLGRYAGVG